MEEVESEEEVRWGLTNPGIDNLFKHEDTSRKPMQIDVRSEEKKIQ